MQILALNLTFRPVFRYSLPEGAKPEDVCSNLAADGVLVVTAKKQAAGIQQQRNVPIGQQQERNVPIGQQQGQQQQQIGQQKQ
jgi:hypothetical protein